MADLHTPAVRPSGDDGRPRPARPAEFRYGAVFVLVLVVVVWLILTPGGNWSHAVAFALESAALIVVVGTSRARPDVRRLRARAGALAAAVLVLAVAAGVLPAWAVLVGGGALSIAIPLALIGGLLRLVRTHGVTLQAGARSLPVYLLPGLAFARVIRLLAPRPSPPLLP